MAKKNQWICGHVDNLWKETSVTKRDKIMLLENRPKTPTESTTNSRGVTSVTKRDKCDIFNLGIERDSVTTPPYRGVVMSRYPGLAQSHHRGCTKSGGENDLWEVSLDRRTAGYLCIPTTKRGRSRRKDG